MFKPWSTSQRLLLLVTLLLYVLSFPLTAFTYEYQGTKTMAGYTAFLMGGVAFLGGGAEEWLLWMANPLFMLSIFWLARKKINLSLAGSIVAVLTALSFLLVETVLAAESGSRGAIESRGPGYYLWLSGMIALLVTVAWMKATDIRMKL